MSLVRVSEGDGLAPEVLLDYLCYKSLTCIIFSHNDLIRLFQVAQ